MGTLRAVDVAQRTALYDLAGRAGGSSDLGQELPEWHGTSTVDLRTGTRYMVVNSPGQQFKLTYTKQP